MIHLKKRKKEKEFIRYFRCETKRNGIYFEKDIHVKYVRLLDERIERAK